MCLLFFVMWGTSAIFTALLLSSKRTVVGSLLFEACLFEEPYKEDRPVGRVAQRLVFALACVQNCLVERVRLDVDRGFVRAATRCFVDVAMNPLLVGTRGHEEGCSCSPIALREVMALADAGHALEPAAKVERLRSTRACPRRK